MLHRWPHGSPDDAKHRRGRAAALLTMRGLRPHPEEARSAVSKDEASELVIVLPRCRQHRSRCSSTIFGYKPVIPRRQALGLVAAASLLPSRAFANASYQRSEFREDLAKRFFDLGTEGTFVGYKGDDYLIIASDKIRSGEAKLPPSTCKIPNSIIALA